MILFFNVELCSRKKESGPRDLPITINGSTFEIGGNKLIQFDNLLYMSDVEFSLGPEISIKGYLSNPSLCLDCIFRSDHICIAHKSKALAISAGLYTYFRAHALMASLELLVSIILTNVKKVDGDTILAEVYPYGCVIRVMFGLTNKKGGIMFGLTLNLPTAGILGGFGLAGKFILDLNSLGSKSTTQHLTS